MQVFEYACFMDSSGREQVAELFKVLMHPERLAILEMLREGERCVCEIEEALGQRQAYVSQQLSVLRSAGLVESRRDKWRIIYRLTSPDVLTLIYNAQALCERLSPQPITVQNF
jgi:ArsR family transcriptional regulator